MRLIFKNKIIDGQTCERMLRLLGRQFCDEEALSQIPPNIFVADKNGAVDQSSNEVLYVNGHYTSIFCVCTKNNTATSWDRDNEAWIFT